MSLPYSIIRRVSSFETRIIYVISETKTSMYYWRSRLMPNPQNTQMLIPSSSLENNLRGGESVCCWTCYLRFQTKTL